MVENGKEILKQIQIIRNDYEAHTETEEEVLQERLSFLDRVNRLIRLILNDDSSSIYDALNEDTIKEWQKRRQSKVYKIKNFLKNNGRKLLYFLLLVTITGFLVSEALGFYAVDGFISTKTYVKAILTEICFIFLSGYRTKTKIGMVWVGVLRACIFTLMMFVISSQVLIQGTKEIGNTDAIQQQIVVIEEQIKEKKKDIEFFRKKNWPRNVARLTIEKKELANKLLDLKEQQAKGSNEKVSELVRYRMYGRASFRILLLFISVLITRRIFTF